MENKALQIVLADDDLEECELFEAALKEIAIPVQLTAIHTGVHLLQWLNANKIRLPDFLFPDLTMPPENGLELLIKIKKHPDLRSLPVIIISHTCNPRIVDALYENGALYYLQKPFMFQQQVEIIRRLPALPKEMTYVQPPKVDFFQAFRH